LAKATNTLLDAVKAAKPARRKIWFDDLNPKQQAELIEVRELWRAGEIELTKNEIRRELIGKVKLPSVEQFRRWMNGE
jgi:hypothetical protein